MTQHRASKRYNIFSLTITKLFRIVNMAALEKGLNFFLISWLSLKTVEQLEEDYTDKPKYHYQECLLIPLTIYILLASAMCWRRSSEVVDEMFVSDEKDIQPFPQSLNRQPLPGELIPPLANQERWWLNQFYQTTTISSATAGTFQAIRRILIAADAPDNYALYIAAFATAATIFPLLRERELRKNIISNTTDVFMNRNDFFNNIDYGLYYSVYWLYPLITALPQLRFSLPVIKNLIEELIPGNLMNDIGLGVPYVIDCLALALWYQVSQHLTLSNLNSYFRKPRNERQCDWIALSGSVASGTMLYPWLVEFSRYKLPFKWHLPKYHAIVWPIALAPLEMFGQYVEHYKERLPLSLRPLDQRLLKQEQKESHLEDQQQEQGERHYHQLNA